MITTFSIKTILAVSLVLIMGSTAGAWVSSTSTSQKSCTPTQILLKQCSIISSGLLKGLSNTTNTETAYSVSILIEAGAIVSVNPAFNAKKAEGTPFEGIVVELQISDLVGAEQISRNGRATSEITFHDDLLLEAILAGLTASCEGGSSTACASLDQYNFQITQHPNWNHGVVITQLQVLGIQWTDETGNCDLLGDHSGCTLTDAEGSTCEAPQNVKDDPKAFVWKAFDYACTEACHDRTGTSCSPYTLPLP